MSDFFDYQDFVPTVATQGAGGRFRLGVVQSVSDNYTLSCTVAGSTTVLTGIRYLGHIHPVPGAPIWLITDGLDVFAFGVQAGANRTFAPRVSRSTDQNIGDATDTAITFDGANNDPWAAWSSGQAQRVYARITGRHIAIAQVSFAANANGLRSAWIERTGTSTIARVQHPAAGGGPMWINVVSQPFDMTAGTDYVRLLARQTSGGSLAATNSSTYSPALSLIYLGP